MYRLSLLAMLVLVSCNSSVNGEIDSSKNNHECYFKAGVLISCTLGAGKDKKDITILTKQLAEDEFLLTIAIISANGIKQDLPITADVSMLNDSVGVILSDDINFDEISDLAISTSFGVANQYFDYWIFDVQSRQYRKIGNYPRLTIDKTGRTVTTRVKLNAAEYQTLNYIWRDSKLVPK